MNFHEDTFVFNSEIQGFHDSSVGITISWVYHPEIPGDEINPDEPSCVYIQSAQIDDRDFLPWLSILFDIEMLEEELLYRSEN